MKKLFVAFLSLVVMLGFTIAGNINRSDISDKIVACGVDMTENLNYYVFTGYTTNPYDRFWNHSVDSFISAGNSSVQIWRNGVILGCSDWGRVSNVVEKMDENGVLAVQNIDGCTFVKPNYLKTGNKATEIDAQIHYTIGYFESGGTSTGLSRFYYRDFGQQNWTCYPGGQIKNSFSECPSVPYTYKNTVKQHTGECLNYRIFRCGDGLVNGYNGSINYENDTNEYGTYLHSYTEQCDPEDPTRSGWNNNGYLCNTSCQLVADPNYSSCGNGQLDEGEECEFSVGGNPSKPGGKGSGTPELYQGSSNQNLGCDQNCQLKEVSCNLWTTPVEQLVGQPISFSATKDNWADFVSLDFGDGTNPIQNPVFQINHIYSMIGNFQPILTVTNNYAGIIRSGVELPTATCIANANDVGGNNTGVNVTSGCTIVLSSDEIELGDSFSVNYTVWGNFNSPVNMFSIPQIGNQVIINKKGKITTGVVNYNGNEITNTGSYTFSISGTLNNGMNTQFSCQAILQVVDKGVVGFDLKKVLDYMSGDIVHYTITLTNTGNTVAHNAYIKDTVPPAVTYLTSSIAWMGEQKQNYLFDIRENDGRTIFVYTGLTINPGKSVVVSFTGRLETGEIIDSMVGETLGNMCSDGVRLQVERSFGVVYSAQTQNCAETSGNITVCEEMPEPTILKQQKKVGMAEFTSDNIQVELGDTISYRIDFSNSSSGEVHGVKIEDYLPRCIEYIDSSIYGVQGANFSTGSTSLGATKIIYNQFTLIGGQAGYIVLTGKIRNTSDCLSSYSYINKAYIYFPNRIVFDKVKAKTAKDDGRDIKKQADKQFIDEGENLTYTIIYRNTGDIAWKTGYTLIDMWPEDLTYISDSCNGVCTKTVSNGEYLYTINQSLEGGDSRQLILTGKVDQCPEWGMIVNKVKLEFGREDNTTGEIEGVSVVICGSDDDGWTVRKEADKTYVGNLDDITYTISYRNTGSTTWNSYRLEDEWPAQYLTYKSDSCAAGCTKSVHGNVYTYNMAGSLPAGGTGRLILTGQVGSGVCDGINGGIKNIVRLIYTTNINGSEVEGVTTGEATIYCGSGDDDGWTLRKEADKSNVNEGEELTYKIYYRNTGGVAWEPGYQLTDIWPESLAYGGDTCNGVCSKQEEDGKYIYTMNESLLSGEGRELILTGKVNSCPERGMIVNKVILKYRADGVDGEIEGYSVVICGDDDGWTVKKEADKTRVNNGDNVTYTISYRNTGSTVWNSYRLEDDWPNQYLTYISDSCVEGCEKSVNGNIYTYRMVGSLSAGGTGSLILTGEVDAGACNGNSTGIVNTVKLIYTMIVNGEEVEGTAVGQATIQCTGDIIDENKEGGWVEKISDTDKVTSGDTITYTIRYANTGEHAWESYRLEDIWPQSLECQGNCPWTDEMKYKLEFNRPEGLGVGEDGELILTGKVNQCPNDGNIVNEVNLYYTIMEGTHEYTGAILGATKTIECGSGSGEEPSDSYNLPPCLSIGTTISVMRGELLPVRWRMMLVDGTGNEIEYVPDLDIDEGDILFVGEGECDPNNPKTQIKRDSVWCTFELYDGNKHNQYYGNTPVTGFRLPCFDDKNINNPGLSGEKIFETFSKDGGVDTWNIDFLKVDGRTGFRVDDLLTDFDDTYGEYKLVLKSIEGEYCSNEGIWKPTIKKQQGVCEVNFVLTEPYLMQINTVGALLSTTASFLNSFYTISTDVVITGDIAEKIKVGNVGESTKDISKYVEKFYNKYKSLVINYSGASSRGAPSLKKTPTQQIYFVKASSGAKINIPLTGSFTVFVEGTGVSIVVSGSMKANGMIINPNGIIEFKDNCTSQGQVVRGIFIAKKFDTDNHMQNKYINSPRCFRGNLDVKGVLIGNGIDTLIKNRRSNLNEWTNTTTSTANSRRNQIFKGASLLIEYNTELWSQLPPGAEVFTQVLDVLKK